MIARCGSFVPVRERYLARVPDQLGIADADRQCRFNLLLCLSILAVHVKGPRVAIKSKHIMPPLREKFRLRDSMPAFLLFRALGRVPNIVPAEQLVEMHGGTVIAASYGENQGTTFTVSLPEVLKSKAVEQAVKSDREPSPPKRILVVDDNRISTWTLSH